MRVRPLIRADWERLRDSLPAMFQIVVAAVAALLLAQALLHQDSPIIAAVIPITSLGFVGDARPVRVMETAAAMTLGVVLAEVLVTAFGQAVWSFALALTVTLSLARFVSSKAAFAIAAAVQCTLVMLSPTPPGEQWIRSADAVIGGVVAIVATGLLPRNPWGAAVRAGRRLLRTHVDVFSELATAFRGNEAETAQQALRHARMTNEIVETWRDSVESGRAIAAVSPWFWRKKAEFARLNDMVEPLDLTTRSLRVIARRADYLLSGGAAQPELADMFERLGRAMELVRLSVSELTDRPIAQQELLEIAKVLDPQHVFGRECTVIEANVVHAIRPYVTDALVSTGMLLHNARAALVPVN